MDTLLARTLAELQQQINELKARIQALENKKRG